MEWVGGTWNEREKPDAPGFAVVRVSGCMHAFRHRFTAFAMKMNTVTIYLGLGSLTSCLLLQQQTIHCPMKDNTHQCPETVGQLTQLGQPTANSLPAPTKILYKNVHDTTTVSVQEERQLFIGTLSFDAFVASLLRSDTEIDASVGCATPSFRLSS